MRTRFLTVSFAALLFVSCGGSGGYGGGSSATPPTTPTPTPTGNTNVTTITISGQKGDQSFSPNPAMFTSGQSVMWKNADSTTHRIVIPELGVDTGNIAPGASSAAVTLGDVSRAYHCSIHPSMVGSLNDAATTPSPNGGY